MRFCVIINGKLFHAVPKPCIKFILYDINEVFVLLFLYTFDVIPVYYPKTDLNVLYCSKIVFELLFIKFLNAVISV